MSKEAISTERALKLALEALERMKGYGNVFLHHRHTQNPYEQVCEAITALREALASEAKEQPASGIKQVIELYDSPEKPSGGATSSHQKPFGYIKPGEGDYEKVFSWNYNERNGYTQPVYTSPPAQRTWAGLTDEEMIDLQDRCGISIHQSDFQTIEAKLKEKNT